MHFIYKWRKKDAFSHLGFDDLSQIIEHPTLPLSLLLLTV
jgi:hypothetical protein